ncbi:MAG TPA: amino acid ABC transporter permease [Nocardioidaceae bacterium]|nr:amino acid ABC transporter permease [Nocardioidaceae bacterium]
MDLLRDEFPSILEAFWVTLKLAVLGGFGALVLGTILAAFRVSPVPLLRVVGAVMVHGFRNIPLTLIMFFAFNGLSLRLGVDLAPDSINENIFRLAVLALVVYTASFVCEGMRAGINTVPSGQAEAARAIGLTFTQTLSQVIMPQALRASIAPIGSAMIAMTKNTTVAVSIGVFEASGRMRELVEINSDLVLEIFAIFAFGFMCLTIPMGLLTTWAANRWTVAR